MKTSDGKLIFGVLKCKRFQFCLGNTQSFVGIKLDMVVRRGWESIKFRRGNHRGRRSQLTTSTYGKHKLIPMFLAGQKYISSQGNRHRAFVPEMLRLFRFLSANHSNSSCCCFSIRNSRHALKMELIIRRGY